MVQQNTRSVPAIPMMSRVVLLKSWFTFTLTAPPAFVAASAQTSRSYDVGK